MSAPNLRPDPNGFAPAFIQWISGVGLLGLGVLLSLARASVQGPSQISTLGAVGTMVGLAIAALLLARSTRTCDKRTTMIALKGGLSAGLVYLCEITAEYLWLPDNNVLWAWAEFSAVIALIAATAWRSGRAAQSVPAATLAALVAAFFSYLLWAWGLVGARLLYAGTEREMQVMAAEGDLEDFVHSGVASLKTFLFEDLVGAIFYHALLSMIVAALVGLICGWLAILTSRAQAHQPLSL